WAAITPGRVINKLNAEHLMVFADDLSKLDYARKLTLFYCDRFGFAYDRHRELIRAADDDFVGFVARTPEEWEITRSGMKYLTDTAQHKTKPHPPHEEFTNNTSHKDPAVVEYYKTDRARALDGARIELALKLSKDAIRQETDIDLQEWHFVHG